MSKVKQGRGYVYCIQYHIVRCVKYRRKVLFGDVEKSLKETILKIASDNNFEISEIETNKDHIHLLVECSPQHQIPNIIKALKWGICKITILEAPRN